MGPTLVVMAAGLGSRYGGLKQLAQVGPSGETLLDYAVFDALRAGVRRVVFVIRRELESDFRAHCDARYAGRAEIAYAFQGLTPALAAPHGVRLKPWGTGHAVLSAAAQVPGPFIVCNADDFYGAEGFTLLAEFLAQPTDPGPAVHALVAYELRQTLSEHGSVARGVCQVAPDGDLLGVHEVPGLAERGTGVRAADGTTFRGDEPVSLNLWGFRPGIFAELHQRFEVFRRAHAHDAQAEFFLPAVVDALIREGRARVRVLRSRSPWFGLTHAADRDQVARRLVALRDGGAYPPRLWP